MAESRTGGWLKGCALGCGALVVFVVLIIVGGTMSIMRPMQQAIDAREALEERIGPAGVFTPPADGSVSPERVEAFLSVRAAVHEPCAGIDEGFGSLRRMEEFDGVEEPPRGEALRAGLKATTAAMGLPRLIGRLHLLRNQALLEADMGFGEYVYIYLTAYHHQIAGLPEDFQFLDGDPITPAVHEDLVEMLSRQAEAMRHEEGDVDRLDALEAEIAAVRSDRDRLPWQDGLPAAIEHSYGPFRDRLDELFCPAAVGIELLRNSRHGLSIRAE